MVSHGYFNIMSCCGIMWPIVYCDGILGWIMLTYYITQWLYCNMTFIKGYVTCCHFLMVFLDFDIPQWLYRIVTFILTNICWWCVPSRLCCIKTFFKCYVTLILFDYGWLWFNMIVVCHMWLSSWLITYIDCNVPQWLCQIVTFILVE